ncbi:MAG: penicillin-insensitive murein endopeptidase, partial [Hyphomicrobiaceae bacterium]
MRTTARTFGAVLTAAGLLALASGSVGAQGDANSADSNKAAKSKPVPAKTLFGAARTPASLASRAIGTYARGCLAGAKALPVDGPAWQAMRLSRNRNWGHPALVAFLERFAKEVKKNDGWSGLLVGDMAQPRGGPMLTGHASHQIGLDADIWFTPMPDRKLTREEREKISAVSMLGPDKLSVDPKRWTRSREMILRRAAMSPEVARIFVHPAIKKAMCEAAKAGTFGKAHAWLGKIRPWWGHHYHFHIRLDCPKGSPGCKPQPPAPSDDGCGAELAGWYKRLTAPPPPKPAKPRPPKPPMTIEALPAACKAVIAAGPDAASRASASVPAPKPAALGKGSEPSKTHVRKKNSAAKPD